MRDVGRRDLVATLVAAGAVACSTPATRDSGGPLPRLVFELELREPDSVYLSRPADFVRDAGSIVVADMFQNQIMEFDGVTGQPPRVLGRPGAGPGEFLDIAGLFLIGDTVLGAVDFGRRHFALLDRRSGAFMRSRPFEGWPRSTIPFPDRVVFGAMNLQRGTALGVWSLVSDSITYSIPLAPEYAASPALAGSYTGALVAVWSDTLLLAMSGLNRLEYYSLSGTYLSGLELPVRRRRGSSPAMIEELTPRPGRSVEESWGRVFAIMELHRAPDGRTLIVHGDQQLRVEGRRITGTYFVSVLDADRKRACVDGLLDATRDAQPKFAFRGDTLFVLEQRVGEGTSTRTTASGYLLDTSDCDWLDVVPYAPTRWRSIAGL